MRRGIVAGVLFGVVVAAVGCAAGPDGPYSPETPAGFWDGLWHGIISLVTLVVSLFGDIRMYAADNTGVAYDVGFFLGVACMSGGGGEGFRTIRKRGKRSQSETDWDEVEQKVEAKIKRELAQWAEAEEADDWDEVEQKIEQKVKTLLKEWSEK